MSIPSLPVVDNDRNGVRESQMQETAPGACEAKVFKRMFSLWNPAYKTRMMSGRVRFQQATTMAVETSKDDDGLMHAGKQ